MPKKKEVMVYVYEDRDQNKVEVFDSLEKAKAQAVLDWAVCGPEQEQWEDCGKGKWQYGEYAFVHTKTVK